MIFLLTLFLLLFSAPAHAADLEYRDFAQLPVLEDGRLKPMDTFARNMRLRLAGTATVQGVDALPWLAATLLDPADASQMPTFRITNAHIRAMLKLPERADKTYALAEIAMPLASTTGQASDLLKKDPKQLTRDENDLLKLHENVLMYNQLLQSFSLLLPLPAPAPPALGLAHPTYLQAQRFEPELMEKVRHFLTPDKIEQPELLSHEQQTEASFLAALQQLRAGGERNTLLRVLPVNWQGGQDWLSPWQLALGGQNSPAGQELLGKWQNLASAYMSRDNALWQAAVQELVTSVYQQQPDHELHSRLQLEIAFHQGRVLDVASLLFAAAMLLGLPVLRRRLPARSQWLLVALGTLVLGLGLACRSLILQRPPVGTLYESMLFVGLIIALTALLATRKNLLPALLTGGSVLPLALLALAPFVQQDSESMTMLSAVLNTNFWLTIHVLCITAGYGACLATAALAHAMLATHRTRHDLSARQPLLLKLSLVALLLTAVGTLLGGVWADQSWGRFWGWDPKENGALIIVLWLIWLHHSRIAGQIAPLTFTAGMAALSVVVAQAWFGVNLLSTGLHSYGFIAGIATALFSFTAADLALIALLLLLARKRQAHA